MLIVSKYHDYYDGVAGSIGVDKTCVYNRSEDETQKELITYNSYIDVPPISDHHSNKKRYAPFIVGFCGKLYPGYILKTRVSMYEIDDKVEITYDYKAVEDFIKESETRRYYSYNSMNSLHDFFQLHGQERIDLFRELNCPVFYYERYSRNRNSLKINHPLKDVEFYKVFDAFTAFQEIHMFLSGVLGVNEPKTVEVSDKDKISSRGFDKWSFRNPDPPKRKMKKRKK